MPFIQSADSLKSKVHMSDVSLPVLAGIVALAIIALVLVVQNVAGAIGGHDFTIQKTQSAQSQTADAADASSSAESAPKKTIVVHVSGAVAHPGVYSIDEGSRVQDAVNAAGGFAENAAQDASNLARLCVDGEQIIILTIEATSASSGAGAGAASGAKATGSTAASGAPAGLVNINTATSEQLQTLPGIGAATAQKIIANRDDEGPFQKKEDLKRVSGIGDKKYAALADLISVG